MVHGYYNHVPLTMNRELFLQIADDLMAVLLAVLAAGDVNPVILTVGGFEDELVEVNMAFEPIEPLVSGNLWFMVHV